MTNASKVVEGEIWLRRAGTYREPEIPTKPIRWADFDFDSREMDRDCDRREMQTKAWNKELSKGNSSTKYPGIEEETCTFDKNFPSLAGISKYRGQKNNRGVECHLVRRNGSSILEDALGERTRRQESPQEKYDHFVKIGKEAL